MPDRQSTVPGCKTLGILIAGLLVFTASSAALAAANRNADCDAVARDLKSNDVGTESLAVDIIDHSADDHGATDPLAAGPDPSAPLLFLAPRVVHILQDVFGDTDVQRVSPMERVRRIMMSANAGSKAAQETAPGEAPSGGGDRSEDAAADLESAILAGPMTETFRDSDTLPSFQRQMFRTDI